MDFGIEAKVFAAAINSAAPELENISVFEEYVRPQVGLSGLDCGYLHLSCTHRSHFEDKRRLVSPEAECTDIFRINTDTPSSCTGEEEMTETDVKPQRQKLNNETGN